MSSSQRRVGKVRPPRVQITYDVEDGESIESRELPMVVGVVSDLSGDSQDPTDYRDREFDEVESDGVDRLLSRIGPTVSVTVPDEVSGEEDAELRADLKFDSIDDFSPIGVAAQLPQTAKLLEARKRLSDLYGKVEANDALDGILGDILSDADKRAVLREQLDSLDGDGAENEGDE